MAFDPVIAARRFGCGLSPIVAAPRSVEEMHSRLTGPDEIASRFPIDPYPEFSKRLVENAQLRKALKPIRDTPEGNALQKQIRRNKGLARIASVGWFHQHLMRRIWTKDGLRERLSAFWADHFTTRGRAGVMKYGASPYVESAIRPRVSGPFEDLLIAAVTHPKMVDYLDQTRSMGPNSRGAKKRRAMGRSPGLNENLAREVLELHTLGVDGPYTQTDVRELAKLFAGLSHRPDRGTMFYKSYAEPGAERVLGQRYGGKPSLDPIHDVLRDLARHPDTAKHVCRKLAVHFIADDPDVDLVQHMVQVWRATDGHLAKVYGAMLGHPAAWDIRARNVMAPFDFMAASLRALALDPKALAFKEKHSRRLLLSPLRAMGHRWELPPGPDGLFEADADWVTPQALAMRVQWALHVPSRLKENLPDPRQFVTTALGPDAPDNVRFAAAAAQTVPEAIALVLMSPAFQRV